jgi:hypothetical protein
MQKHTLIRSLRKNIPSFKDGFVRVLALATLLNIAAVMADIGIFEPKNEPTNDKSEYTDSKKKQKGDKSRLWIIIWDSSDRLSTIFIAIFNGILVYVTYRLVTSTDKLWVAGEQQLKLSRGTAERQLRAYLYVVSNTTPDIDGDGPLEGRFLMKNGGQTPAYDVKSVCSATFGRYPFEGEPPPLPEEKFKGGTVLVPGGVVLLSHTYPGQPTETWKKALKEGNQRFVMYGEIRYNDVFGESHVTKYRAMYGGPDSTRLDQIIWCEDGNTAT